MAVLKNFRLETELVLRIILEFDQKPSLKSFTLKNPYRVVLDITKVQGVGKKEVPVKKYKIKEVRLAQYKPDVLRLVIEGEEELLYEVRVNGGQVILEVWAKLLAGKKIVLDPGHGGKDPGAVGAGGIAEKEVTLKLALAGKALIEKLGGEVVLTRDKDVFIPLPQRVKIANNSEARAFISVHLNAATDHTARGIETYFKAGREDSESLAAKVQKQLIDEFGFKDRGLKTATFYVIKNVRLPGILAEIGFITNPEEIKIVNSSDGLSRFARALAKALL
ncbi:N-acetylmuramoyl-L-alanine amidase [Carboxydothermus ferrireducens]|uniref:N-acetylmuramoyl-L-alanine amidase n=1 Tax=Carboxydothermus ferrireducens DSM 11255 TaxID=1119529 RepID=A0ABX2R9U3_9THEO|nr:N-acetylmuramoyl-L-alanine amidase [Carboxydothermus ferrireducens]NYE57695.1 N-acetylmuramoyl-L-alanine amidase [Carboxydothermus ferrireducens DSM 11255]